jgi:hypothetical protein
VIPGGHPVGALRTVRTDRWWLGPVATAFGLGAFIVYATIRAFHGTHYFADPYLSPFYSPLLFANPEYWPGSPVGHSWFGAMPGWLSSIWPSWLPVSPAFFILIFPGSFRATCYYYRKAYYRSFFATPAGCAVCPIGQKSYRGETRLFLFQNLHRYALYASIPFVVILTWDGILALRKDGEWGIGVGTVMLFVNAALIAAYLFGCHSFRHLIGGRLDRFASAAGVPGVAHRIWRGVSWLNARHMKFAWASLVWVALADLYIWAVSKGWIADWNTWGSGS